MQTVENEEDLNRQNGRWWKFDRYTVVDGTIAPASGAILNRFDPWGIHRVSQEKHRTVVTHYESLLTLSRQLTFRPDSRSRYTPTKESAEQVINWCNEFGLLGILPARTEMITLPAGWYPGSELYGPDDQRYCAGYRRFVRRSGVWSEVKKLIDVKNAPRTGEETGSFRDYQPEKVLLPTTVDAMIPEAGALVWLWQSRTFSHEPLYKMRKYFPGIVAWVAESIASAESSIEARLMKNADMEYLSYPRPASVDFWYAYGEPITTFARWAENFRKSVECVGNWSPGKSTSTEQQQEVNESLYYLQGLVATIGEAWQFTPESKDPSRILVSPALISTFAKMALEDMALGRRVYKCETCSKLFVSDEPRSKYCSKRCRSTMQRRRQRAKD